MTATDALRRWLLPFFDPRPLAGIARLPGFFRDWRAFRRGAGTAAAPFADLYPRLGDRTASTPFDPHYFHQGAWIARRLAANPVALHVDIGSSVLTMSVASARTSIVFVDYRPLMTDVDGLLPVAGDVTRLPFADGALASLSCLHVIEHIGLGRYGDPLDPAGSARAAAELQRVVRPGGRLYLSTPVGRERVSFNAHRVFAAATILALLPKMRLASFALVDDSGAFRANAAVEAAAGLEYGCGMFEFVRDTA